VLWGVRWMIRRHLPAPAAIGVAGLEPPAAGTP
jgi:hypothetical protein